MKAILIILASVLVLGLSTGCDSDHPVDLETPAGHHDDDGDANAEADHHDDGDADAEADHHDDGDADAEADHHDDGDAHPDADHQEDKAEALPAGANQMCPVMPDEKALPEFFVEYEGKRIYTCCKECRERVIKNPAEWYEKAYGAIGQN